ncbi:MAG: hypothetical protein ABH836_04945 [Candidatus Omnitrophota bacterium]
MGIYRCYNWIIVNIDEDDLEIFHDFVVNDTRYSVEFDESGKMIIPMSVYNHLKEVFHVKNVSHMPPEFIKRVKEKFDSKKSNLEGDKK